MNSIYLDYCATTPVDPRVQDAMTPYWSIQFGNASSSLHEKGWQAGRAVRKAREQVAALLKCLPEEISFTSGATESNNWALKGWVENYRQENPSLIPHIITSPFEHASVIEPLKFLEKQGQIRLTQLPVDQNGQISISQLETAVTPDTKLISLIWCQNEVGAIQDLMAIAHWAKTKNILVHTDATQMVGKYSVDLRTLPVSLLSFSGHKIYGPKGIGALFIRKSDPTLKLSPLLHGGGQESSGRSGTLNVSGIVGLGCACELAQNEMPADQVRMQQFHQLITKTLKSQFPHVILNGIGSNHSHYLLSLTLPAILPEQIMPHLHQLCVSSGSACGSAKSHLSPTLKALGHENLGPSTTLRLSWGRMCTEFEIESALKILCKSLKLLTYSKNQEVTPEASLS